LLDRLTHAPRELGPVIATRLAREIPWYVTRNLLLILDGLPALPDGFRAAAFIAHEDTRVRREALKVSLKVPAEREPALLGALRDADPRMVRGALTAALEDCPSAALPLITQIVHDQAVASELRVLAIKILGRVRNVAALTTLLEMALAAGWRNDGRASVLLALAAGSNDPDVRNAASPKR